HRTHSHVRPGRPRPRASPRPSGRRNAPRRNAEREPGCSIDCKHDPGTCATHGRRPAASVTDGRCSAAHAARANHGRCPAGRATDGRCWPAARRADGRRCFAERADHGRCSSACARQRRCACDRLSRGARKPSRYAGGELNAVHKRLDEVALRWGLAFPDTYEVGMSNVGFRLLYHALNERPEVACERFFMPWADMESALRAEGLPLFSIESRAPLRAFDVLGFTLQFELCYTTVLAMLELGGVPLATSERGRDDPLVLG